MKRSLLFTMVWLGGATATASAGPIVNGSFEAGFAGWELSEIYWGTTEFTPLFGLAPEGQQQIVDPATPFVSTGRYSWAAPTGGALAVDGDRYAAFGTGHADYLPGQGPFDIYATQTFTIERGEVLAGWSFFYNGDHVPEDTAYVTIFDSSGFEVATPWFYQSGGSSRFSAPFTPWTEWTWSPQESGTYTLKIGVASHGDNYFDSWGFHDAIRVPEPSSLLLFGTAAAGLAAGVRRKSRTS